MCDLLECYECCHKCKNDLTDREVEQLWNELADVIFNEDECGELHLSTDWQGWNEGTNREIIWHWFDKHHSKGVAWLLYEYEG